MNPYQIYGSRTHCFCPSYGAKSDASDASFCGTCGHSLLNLNKAVEHEAPAANDDIPAVPIPHRDTDAQSGLQSTTQLFAPSPEKANFQRPHEYVEEYEFFKVIHLQLEEAIIIIIIITADNPMAQAVLDPAIQKVDAVR